MRLAPSPVRTAAAGLLIALAGGLSQTAMAFEPGGPGGPGHHGGPMMEFSGHMLDSAGVSADQKAQIQAIFKAARTDLSAQHASEGALRAQALQNFAATTIDPNAAESLRQQMLAQHDAASKRMLQATIAAANVLTAAQRQTIASQISQHMALAQKQRSEREALDGSAR